ncbi:MAG: hypothetical protein RH917_05270 [Lacipirellulaceae bacterium]
MSEMLKTAVEVPIPFNMIIILGSLFFVVAAIVGVAKEVQKFASHRVSTDFKREMIDQGMSVDEIERILAAGQE